MSSFFDTFKPRDYQTWVHNELRKRYDEGKFRFLIRLFTGAGKTTGVAAFLPRIFPDLTGRGPLLFLSHRREILFHAYSKFTGIYDDAFTGIEMGEYHASGVEDMVFVSVDSLGRLESTRLNKYKNIKPGIIICDEGHHVTENGTWDRILKHFGVGSDLENTYRFNGHAPLVLFMTATPNRGDGKTLGRFVEDYEIDLGIDYGIDNGWLVRPEMYDLHLVGKQWAEMSMEERAAAVCKVKEQYAVGMQTLVFASSVAESKIITATLNEHKIGRKAAHIDGTTDKEYRDQVTSSFYPDKEIETLSNRLVFTEGYDNPFIKCIIDNGRTESDSLFEQKIGRGLRTLPGVVDHLATKEERLEAIAKSEKPYVLVLVTYDSSHLSLSPQINLKVIDEQGDEKMPLVSPVVDVLVYEDDLGDEVPPRNWEEIESTELFAVRRDIWTGTVFNERLRAITDLRWIIDPKKESASLWIQIDPTGKTDTPVIWNLKKIDGERKWELQIVNVGGWSENLGRPTKASVEYMDSTLNFNATLRHLDECLKKWAPGQYAAAKTDAYPLLPATENEKKYLSRSDVKYGSGITRRTAHILIDNERIKTSLSKLGLV